MQQAITVLFMSGFFVVLAGVWVYRRERDSLEEFERRLTEKEQSLLEVYAGLEELIYEMQRIHHSHVEGVRQQSASEVQDATRDQEPDAMTEEMNTLSRNRAEEVQHLLEQGISDEEIASRLKTGLGEVLLMKSLNTRR